ncbi:MAG: hypothetical protein K8H85_07935 [Cyclobacteriaceae bacterium]|nr:hypothetical protein [Cyclobacteriaceae bacterium]
MEAPFYHLPAKEWQAGTAHTWTLYFIDEILEGMNRKHVNMAFYKPEYWSRLLSIVDDKEVFHDTWEQWFQQYQSSKKQLESEMLKVNDVVISIDDLISFCFQNGVKNDGKARSRFVAQIII